MASFYLPLDRPLPPYPSAQVQHPSVVPFSLTCAQVQHPSFFVGIILRGVTLPVPNHGHVVLAKPSPILFYPISSTEVRCVPRAC